MDEIKGTLQERIKIDFNYVQKRIMEYKKGDVIVDQELLKTFDIVLFQASAEGMTDIVESLLNRLDNTVCTNFYEHFRCDDRHGLLVYDCLCIALEKNHNSVLRILLNCSKPANTTSSGKVPKNRTPLVCAAANGDVEIATLLIESGIDVNQANGMGETALHFAYDTAIAQVLLNNGADVNAVTTSDKTPLYYACASRRVSVVRTLLEKGAIPTLGSNNFMPSNIATKDPDVDTSIATFLINEFKDNDRGTNFPYSCHVGLQDYSFSVCNTCKIENKATIEKLLAMNTVVDQDAAAKLPPLHQVILEFHRMKVQMNSADIANIRAMLSTADKATVNTLSSFGTTALYLAVERNLAEVATTLLDAGADPNLTSSTKYPLIKACMYLSYELVKFLLTRGANPNVADSYRRSPLSLAAASFDLRLVKLLVEHGADVNHRDYRCTPLEKAFTEMRYCPNSGTACVEIAKYLLDKGSNIKAASKGYFSLLSYASLMLVFYLRVGRFARVSICYQLFDLLLERGADITSFDFFDMSFYNKSFTIDVYYLLREYLRRGGNSNQSDKYGNSLLTVSCESSNIRTVRILLAAGADLTRLNGYSLLCASVTNNLELVNLLLSKGVDFNVPDDKVANSYIGASCGIRTPDVLTFCHFFAPFCQGTDSIIQLFKAGSTLKILATWCRVKMKRMTTLIPSINCPLAVHLCKAVVLAGHNVEQKQLVELLLRSGNSHDLAMVSWLVEDSKIPPSLFRQSRTVIRRQLSAASENRTILPLIDALQIDDQFRMYLRFEGPCSEIDLAAAAGDTGCDACRTYQKNYSSPVCYFDAEPESYHIDSDDDSGSEEDE